MKKLVLVICVLALSSCAQLGMKSESANEMKQNQAKTVDQTIKKDKAYYSTNIQKSTEVEEFRTLLQEIMSDINLSLKEKSELVGELKMVAKKLQEKESYIDQKIMIKKAKLEVETQTKIGTIELEIMNDGDKVVKEIKVEITDDGTFEKFPLKLTLVPSDENIKEFKYTNTISELPEKWNQKLSIKVLDIYFL
jgi:thiol:disulfide interchange protein